MNKMDGIVAAQSPAAIDDFLRTALHLGVAALHRSKVQIGLRGAAIHRRGRTTAQTDEHGRTAEQHHVGTDRAVIFFNLIATDVAHTAGDHDGLVITTHTPCVGILGLLEAAEIAGDARPPELVIECSRTQRRLEHDV